MMVIFPCLLFTSALLSMESFTEGSQLFNPDVHMCCNGTLVSRSENLECCGSTVYDSSQSVCCGSQVQPFPSSGGGNFACCSLVGKPSDGKEHHQQLQVAYDPVTHECCNGQVLKKDDPERWYGCCSDRLYHPESHVCCNGHLIERTDEQQDCCGDVLYYVYNQTCCQEWENEVDDSERLGTRWTPHVRLHETPSESDMNCCRLDLYNPRNEVCCKSSPTVRSLPQEGGDNVACCGDALIWDHEEEICCDDKVLIRAYGHDTRCCPLLGSYNQGEHVCCGGQLYPLEESKDCCWSTGQLFDIEHQVCCDTEILNISEEDREQGRVHCC